MSVEALLGLGSNLGNRKALIDDAVWRLGGLPGTRLRARSSYYQTVPVGPVKQEWFLNIAVALATDMSQSDLLTACHAIETTLGRDRSREIFWGPRPIDIDLIAYAEWFRFDERAFVLIPLAEIAPLFRADGQTLAEHAARVGIEGVEKLDWSIPHGR